MLCARSIAPSGGSLLVGEGARGDRPRTPGRSRDRRRSTRPMLDSTRTTSATSSVVTGAVAPGAGGGGASRRANRASHLRLGAGMMPSVPTTNSMRLPRPPAICLLCSITVSSQGPGRPEVNTTARPMLPWLRRLRNSPSPRPPLWCSTSAERASTSTAWSLRVASLRLPSAPSTQSVPNEPCSTARRAAPAAGSSPSPATRYAQVWRTGLSARSGARTTSWRVRANTFHSTNRIGSPGL